MRKLFQWPDLPVRFTPVSVQHIHYRGTKRVKDLYTSYLTVSHGAKRDVMDTGLWLEYDSLVRMSLRNYEVQNELSWHSPMYLSSLKAMA